MSVEDQEAPKIHFESPKSTILKLTIDPRRTANFLTDIFKNRKIFFIGEHIHLQKRIYIYQLKNIQVSNTPTKHIKVNLLSK